VVIITCDHSLRENFEKKEERLRDDIST